MERAQFGHQLDDGLPGLVLTLFEDLSLSGKNALSLNERRL
jgi:hypothetical protein